MCIFVWSVKKGFLARNQADLIAAATAEKTALLERLRAYFDETSRLGSLDRRAKEAEAVMIETSMVPYTIYIG